MSDTILPLMYVCSGLLAIITSPKVNKQVEEKNLEFHCRIREEKIVKEENAFKSCEFPISIDK